MTNAYFAIGTTQANLVNVETIVTDPPTVLRAFWVPLLGPVARRPLSGKLNRDGAVKTRWDWPSMSQDDHVTWINNALSGFLVASVPRVIATLDEMGKYSIFDVKSADKPQADDQTQNYEIVNDYWLADYQQPLFGLTLAYVAISSSQAITTAQRMVLADTSAGSVTITLPAASAPAPNTPFCFWKQSAANNLVIQRAGADTVGAGTSITLTALEERAELVSDGVSAWTRI